MDLKKLIKKRVPVAICYLFATVVFAQSEKDVLATRKKTDVKGLEALKISSQKGKMSVSRLKAEAKKRNIPFRGESNGRIYQLQGFDKRGKPIYYITYNSGASKGISSNKVNSSNGIFGLDGEGIILHEWDGGAVRSGHVEFGDRVTQEDKEHIEEGVYEDHSTHVAGTMVAAGVNGKAKGMAPKATLKVYEWTEDIEEMISAAIDGALVSNHSYGAPGGFEVGDYYQGQQGWYWSGDDADLEYIGYGHYSEVDAQWDYISVKAPYYLPVKAAGNSRGGGPSERQIHFVRKMENGKEVWKPSRKKRQKNGGEHGFDTIVQGTTGKNVLVVGAAHKMLNGYQQPSDVQPTVFTCFGPTDDGRIKPDIMGIGFDIYSATGSGDNKYTEMSGTSMAAPGVTASLGLLQEQYKKLYGTDDAPFMKSATLKGLAIHTANEAGDADGPDYRNGWGLMNTLKAVQTLSVKDKYSLVNEEFLNNGETKEISVTASGQEPLKVTISWDDPVMETLPEYKLNNETPTLVNDLDIKIIDTETQEEHLAWILDPKNPLNPATKGDNFRDNVEQVEIKNPVKGRTYKVKVSHKNPLKTNPVGKTTLVNADSQAFSLIATGISQGVATDLAVEEIKLPTVIEYSEQTPVEIKVKNLSNGAITGAKLKYKLINTETNEELKGGEISLTEISANATHTETIHFSLTKAFVEYSIVAEVVYEGDEVLGNNKLGVSAYGVVTDLTQMGSHYAWGFDGDLTERGWSINNVNADKHTWTIIEEPEFSRSGNTFAISTANGEGTNDWLFSNPLKLKQGAKYRLIFHGSKLGEGIEEKLNVFVGNTASPDAMTNKIGEIVLDSVAPKYGRYMYEFIAEQDGVHYIGFNHNTEDESYSIMIDDFSIHHIGGKVAPDFYITKKDPNSYEVVELKNETIVESGDNVTYEWAFNPNTVTFKENTNRNSENPKVVFNEQKVYDITLKATNSAGENSFTRQREVVVENTPVYVDMVADRTQIYQGEVVKFTDDSKGNPMPDRRRWTFEPNTIEYVNGTNQNSEIAYVKFKEPGFYTAQLESASPYTGQGERIPNFIEVKPVYLPVKNEKGAFNKDKNEVKLGWNRPDLLPIYFEGFEGSRRDMPSDFTLLNDGKSPWTWEILSFRDLVHTGRRCAYASSQRTMDVSGWLVTGKVGKGAEVLDFWYRSMEKERFDVVLIPAANVAGEKPNIAEAKTGIVLKEIVEKTGDEYKNLVVDVSSYKDTEYYIAIHHKTTKEDAAEAPRGVTTWLLIDDISLGFKPDTEKVEVSTNKITAESRKMLKKAMEGKGIHPMFKNRLMNNSGKDGVQVPKVNVPRLTGYEVVKQDQVLKNTSDVSDKTYQETINEVGTHTYDVYAVYSDGRKSEPITITLEIEQLSTSDVKGNEAMKIYPNPSNGLFVVETKTGVSSLKAEVYDMSGKLIFKKDYQGNKADLNLTQYPKGTYLLNIVDNNGVKQSAKLMIK